MIDNKLNTKEDIIAYLKEDIKTTRGIKSGELYKNIFGGESLTATKESIIRAETIIDYIERVLIPILENKLDSGLNK